jgi:glycerol-3-phosphate cytidylyltransferase-like family protein
MKKIVIMPGGFHPFHAGHAALYQRAVKAFPDADVYVAASNDTSERPFPFAIKEKLARVAGVPPGRFVQVKSPFTSEEITSKYDPNSTVLIFVKSQKNAKNGADPEGPFPAEVDPSTGKLPLVTRGPRKGQPVSDRLQYYKGNEKNLQPMSQHSYLAYLPTVKFGPGISSASEIRAAWPTLNDKRKTAMVMSLYPETQKNPKLAANVVKMLDMGMGGQEGVAEGKQIWDGADWGPQGNFAGDRPVNIGGATVNKLQVGDIVTYFGQKAKIEAMSKTGNTSRITIANKMGGITQDVLTRDLKRTGVAEEIGGVGGGFGTNYPGTYEEENGPFTHKGGLKLTSLTTESVDYLDEK